MSCDNTINTVDVVEQSSYYWNGEPIIRYNQTPPLLDKPLAVDLFCGMGGLSIGFENAGFEIILGVDIHVPSIETFSMAHPRAITILGDIRKTLYDKVEVKESTLVKTVETAAKGKIVDVLMAGIPCQGFSLANKKRNVNDSRNYLYKYFVDAARALKPTFVVIENVDSIRKYNEGSFTENILKELEDAGYRTDHRILNAADYGVPQMRKRMIFIGAREDMEILWPNKIYGMNTRPYRTVRDAISDLPKINSCETANDYVNPPLTDYQALMRAGSSSLNNHKAPNHPRATIERIAKTKPGQSMYKSYSQRKRLCWDKPSPTQVSGGIRPQFQFGHPEQNRGLTVRERCRIQSIPDRIFVAGLVVQGRVQTGNVVPPLLAEEVGKCIYLSLNRKQFKSALLEWGSNNKRYFPWRDMDEDPYKSLITEMLLRKTRAENLAKIYDKLLHLIPTFKSIIEVDLAVLEVALKPLGLSKTRAKAFKRLAEEIVKDYDGKIPADVDKLCSLPHVGRYTANAYLLFGFNQNVPIVDVNVQRIFSRVFNITAENEIHKHDYMWELCHGIMPTEEPREFGVSLLDFGAIICKALNPKCEECPIIDMCLFYKTRG